MGTSIDIETLNDNLTDALIDFENAIEQDLKTSQDLATIKEAVVEAELNALNDPDYLAQSNESKRKLWIRTTHAQLYRDRETAEYEDRKSQANLKLAYANWEYQKMLVELAKLHEKVK